jgi:hypothetical protein
MVRDIHIPSVRHGHKGNRLACDAREVVGILAVATGTLPAAGEQTIRGVGQSAVGHPKCFGVVKLAAKIKPTNNLSLSISYSTKKVRHSLHPSLLKGALCANEGNRTYAERH